LGFGFGFGFGSLLAFEYVNKLKGMEESWVVSIFRHAF
jgi:hypothetical protein